MCQVHWNHRPCHCQRAIGHKPRPSPDHTKHFHSNEHTHSISAAVQQLLRMTIFPRDSHVVCSIQGAAPACLQDCPSASPWGDQLPFQRSCCASWHGCLVWRPSCRPGASCKAAVKIYVMKGPRTTFALGLCRDNCYDLRTSISSSFAMFLQLAEVRSRVHRLL